MVLAGPPRQPTHPESLPPALLPTPGPGCNVPAPHTVTLPSPAAPPFQRCRSVPRVLIVEDNELNRDMLSRRLTRRGFEVLLATDGAQGVEAARAHRPDLILMDMSLPVVDGWEATRRIKAAPETGAIPDHRPHRARHGRRRGEGTRRRLRRLRHEAGGAAAPAREDGALALPRDRRAGGAGRRRSAIGPRRTGSAHRAAGDTGAPGRAPGLRGRAVRTGRRFPRTSPSPFGWPPRKPAPT